MLLQVDFLLCPIKLAKPCGKERVRHFVIFRLGKGNPLSGLVVSERPSLRHDRDVRGRVYLLEHHLELVEQSQSLASLSFHDLLDSAGRKLDFQGA